MDIFLTVVACLGIGVVCGALAVNSSRRNKNGKQSTTRPTAQPRARITPTTSAHNGNNVTPQTPAIPSVPQLNGKSGNNSVIIVKPCPGIPAKDAVIANIDNLRPLLDAVAANTKVTKEINDAIVSINNKELSELWVKVHSDNTLIDRVLSMWGISREFETQFKGMSHHSERYNLSDGSDIVLGTAYVVVKPCWILTYEDTSGKVNKRIVNKGLARKL